MSCERINDSVSTGRSNPLTLRGKPVSFHPLAKPRTREHLIEPEPNILPEPVVRDPSQPRLFEKPACPDLGALLHFLGRAEILGRIAIPPGRGSGGSIQHAATFQRRLELLARKPKDLSPTGTSTTFSVMAAAPRAHRPRAGPYPRSKRSLRHRIVGRSGTIGTIRTDFPVDRAVNFFRGNNRN
jgi:hypothetical protein